MEMIKIGVITEGKVPPDERVPLTPAQVIEIDSTYSNIDITVQSSNVRRIADQEYSEAGVRVVKGVNDAAVLIGVKEVPIPLLIEDKTYMFFSHTIKMQPYNKELLQAVLKKRIRLIDWECLRDGAGRRLIGFGRYAGIVGAYNGFRALGLRDGVFSLRKAKECKDRIELEKELEKIQLPGMKILLTGRGKVAKGAMEVLDLLGIQKVGIREYLTEDFKKPVYCQITFKDYFKPKDPGDFSTNEFFEHPDRFESNFMRFAEKTNMLIAGHYWNAEAPFIFTRADAKNDKFRIDLVADISCDIDGPIASTLRPSTIEDPFYGYDPESESEVSFGTADSITVMAVDNLPCELPRDASFDFGEMFIHSVLPSFLNEDKNGILERATITEKGALTKYYEYLSEWVNS